MTTTALAATAVAGAFLSLALATAQVPAPSPPTFAYVYGRVLAEGMNLSPETQPVIAFVNGKSCEGAPSQTLVASSGDDVPEEDVDRTVYVIDVLADGANNYERAGCGHTGDPIMLYFPVSGRTSSQQPLFQPGPIRADLDLDIELSHRSVVPALASEGTN